MLAGLLKQNHSHPHSVSLKQLSNLLSQLLLLLRLQLPTHHLIESANQMALDVLTQNPSV